MASSHALIGYWDAAPPEAGRVGAVVLGALAPFADTLAFTAKGEAVSGAPEAAASRLPGIDREPGWMAELPGGPTLAFGERRACAVSLDYHVGLMDDPGGAEAGLRAAAAALVTAGGAALAWVTAVPTEHAGAQVEDAARVFCGRGRGARLPARRLTAHAHLVAWRIGAWADERPHLRAGGACFWLGEAARRGPVRR